MGETGDEVARARSEGTILLSVLCCVILLFGGWWILTRSQETADDAREDDADGPLHSIGGRTPVAFLLVLTGFGVSTLPGLLLAFDLFLVDENRQGRGAEVWVIVGCGGSCVVN